MCSSDLKQKIRSSGRCGLWTRHVPRVRCHTAQALVIVTEWEQFRALDLARLKAAMANPVVVDLRNVYRPDEMKKYGFTYSSVGRATQDR